MANHVHNEESDFNVHRVNSQHAEEHVQNFRPTEIQITSLSVAVLHSSAVGDYRMRSECGALICAYAAIQ